MLDDLFDVFNSATFDECKVFHKPLSENSKHWNLLEKSLHFFTKLETKNEKKKHPKSLYHDLINNFDFEYVFTRRLTQDCLESLFSAVRVKGGNNTTPDSTKFYSAIRMCVTQQLIVPPASGNRETDACEFLTSCADLLRNKKQFQFKLQTLNQIYFYLKSQILYTTKI